MDETNFYFTLDHVKASATLLQRLGATLEEDKGELQKELDALDAVAPGYSNQYDKKAPLRRKIFAIEREIDLTMGRRVAALELARTLEGITDINATLEQADALARRPFPADRYAAVSGEVLLGYAFELKDLIKRLADRTR